MKILTDEEITTVFNETNGESWRSYARAIEAAILERIGEPVAWMHSFEKQNGDVETDASVSFAVAKAFCDFGAPVPLFAIKGVE